ncbi:MAG: anti-sigma regulatory factor [Nitrospirae bacterium]|nr:MAG: anti-sigma regulatory factor [Nitrospirota bacterium]
MSGDVHVAIERDADIVTARQRGRELAREVGFSGTEQTLITLAISEIARNIVSYARRGGMTLTRVQDAGRSGISIVARDEGPGIPDIELAMRDGYSTGKSLGVGLPGSRRVVDEFVLTSTVGVGTTITMKKWLR